jgi:hypothetical protein
MATAMTAASGESQRHLPRRTTARLIPGQRPARGRSMIALVAGIARVIANFIIDRVAERRLSPR